MDQKRIADNRRYSVPACTVSEDQGLVMVRLELPGVAKENIEVRIEGNELSVTGERRTPAPAGEYLLRERRAEAYRKLFTLDDSISRETVDASLDNGVLVLKLNIKAAAKPRRIEIA
jgi:HSP20 family protein